MLIKTPSRIAKIAADIADHFRRRSSPKGFKAQVVAYDKASCVAYKDGARQASRPRRVDDRDVEESRSDPPTGRSGPPDADELEQIVARFNDPADPLKIIIVTAKLLTGFDAPILYCQYLDKPLKEHTLLQAITRTNRVYPPNKTHGLIVDYLGIFDDVAKALTFDEKSVQQVITNIEELKKQLEPAIAAALAFFPGVDRTVGGYEGLVQAQSAIADDATKDAFGLAYSVVSQLWEALSPDPMLAPVSRRLPLADRRLRVGPTLRHHRPARVARARRQDHRPHQRARPGRDPAERGDDRPRCPDHRGSDARQAQGHPAKEIEKQITARIARHLNNPVFVELGKRLNALREKYADIQQSSLDFLRELLELARDTVAAEKASTRSPARSRARRH